MSGKTRIVIIGASSAMAEHCARLWAARPSVDFVLVGRDQGRLERIAADLRVRNPQAGCQLHVANFLDPAAIDTLIRGICAGGAIDIALIAHGSLPDQAACEQDLTQADEALRVNGLSPVLFAEAIAGAMQKAGQGRLALIGSVAGDRGRKSNYVYGAAKGLVSRYAQGLQHRFHGSAVRVTLIKPGPTDTPMTVQMKQQGLRLASVEQVAQAIVHGIDAGKPVVYAPAKWRLIMLIIQHLPGFVFNRLQI